MELTLLIEAVTESASDILMINMSSCQSLIKSVFGSVKQNKNRYPSVESLKIWIHKTQNSVQDSFRVAFSFFSKDLVIEVLNYVLDVILILIY